MCSRGLRESGLHPVHAHQDGQGGQGDALPAGAGPHQPRPDSPIFVCIGVPFA